MNVDPIVRCAELRAEAHELFALLGRVSVKASSHQVSQKAQVLRCLEKTLADALSILPDPLVEETLRWVREAREQTELKQIELVRTGV
jgi:hypothetical protein